MLVARIWVSSEIGSAEWYPGLDIELPAHAVRHIQVLRMQPGDDVNLFNGQGGLWAAKVLRIGRRDAAIQLISFSDEGCELPVEITLAVGMPANDRMDALVEKATELGVRAIQPLICARSVLKLDGDRAVKKVAHWQSVAVAACEQSGRTRLPLIHPVLSLSQWLNTSATMTTLMNRAVLSFAPQQSAFAWLNNALEAGAPHRLKAEFVFLSGPEGGLSSEEEAQALRLGFHAVGLGPRVLRADTAPLMALSIAAALFEARP